MSINLHVNLAVNVADAGGAQANFGTAMVVAEHTVTANRQDGPFSALPEVVAAGFTVAATPIIHAAATQFFSQRPRGSQMKIGRRAALESMPVALDAIEAVDPAGWYLTVITLNTANEILAAATWHETRNKICVTQSSSADMLAGTASEAQATTVTVGGTIADGQDYTIQILNAWTGGELTTFTVSRAAGTPVDNDAVAAALRAGLTPLLAGSAVVSGATDEVIVTFLGLGNGYDVVLTATGTGTLTEVTPAFVQNVGELGLALAFDNTAVIYHDSDTEFLDMSWSARCLAFSLDAPNGAGSWAYQRLSAITATMLTSAQKQQLLAYNVNYYSPVTFTSGVEDAGFTFKGRMLSGQAIDVTTTVHHTTARLEEALLAAFTAAAASSRPKIPFTDSGIATLQGTALGVLNKQVKGGHFADQAESSATGRVTPYVDAPLAAEVSIPGKAAGRIVMQAEAVLAGSILSVGDAATVGFTLDLTF